METRNQTKAKLGQDIDTVLHNLPDRMNCVAFLKQAENSLTEIRFHRILRFANRVHSGIV